MPYESQRATIADGLAIEAQQHIIWDAMHLAKANALLQLAVFHELRALRLELAASRQAPINLLREAMGK